VRAINSTSLLLQWTPTLSMTRRRVTLKKLSLEPHPDFNNIHALKQHVIKALSQMFSPQNAVLGWAGLGMDPARYQLLGGTVFAAIRDSGPTAIYPQWAAPTTIKMIDATFLREKNYLLSYKNIERPCFRMSDANIGAQFKVSNNPTPTGWNSTIYLGMDLNFANEGIAQISMIPYTTKILTSFPKAIATSCTTPPANHLITICDEATAKFLPEAQAQAFHHTVAQLPDLDKTWGETLVTF
jgi:hypothetical protein